MIFLMLTKEALNSLALTAEQPKSRVKLDVVSAEQLLAMILVKFM